VIKRRDFFTLLGGTAAAWPLAARGQQIEQERRIGLLTGEDYVVFVGALREELHKLGWIDGGNLRIERRTSAAELLAIKPDVMIAENTPAVQDLQRHTRTIPIVFVGLGDPVLTGVVASLPRPGGNATGFMNPEPSIGGKWLELLKEIAPAMDHVLVLLNAGNVANVTRLRAIEAFAPALGVRVSSGAVHDGGEIEAAIDAIGRESNAAIIVTPGPPNDGLRKTIFASAARHRLPGMYPYRYYAADGGLMSYGADRVDMWRRAATYVDRVLRGEKPADLPVQAPTKYELVINLKTARALGLNIPTTLLARSDEVIE
jgi:putative ABC transport system substrate-binding protein